MSRRLRVALLHPDRPLYAWELQCVQRLLASPHVQLVLSVRVDLSEQANIPASAFQRYVQKWVRPRARALSPAERCEGLCALPALRCLGEPSESDVVRLRAEALDLIVVLGVSSIHSRFIDCSQHGVLRFAHDSDAALPNALCTKPVLEGAVKTANELLWTLPSGDVRVLHRGFFATCRASLTHNLDRVCFGSAGWAARGCAEIALGKVPDLGPPVTPFQGASQEPDLTRLLASMTCAFTARAHELAFYVQDWNVGTLRIEPAELVARHETRARDVTWLGQHKKGTFVADPFAYEDGQGERILVEEYDHQGKGRISLVTEPDSQRALAVEVLLDLPEHMSYPCIFVEDGITYMVPEIYQSRSARLYRREGKAWVYQCTLLEGAPIVDPTLFKHEGRYYILCSHADDGAYGNQMLHGYVSERLEGPYSAHPLNPLKCDIASSRPAGVPFRLQGALYRPSQDCSETYGGALVINRIERLSPTDFHEVNVARLTPAPDGPYPHGLHTLNLLRQGALIDGKRFVFDLLGFRKNWELRRELLW